MVLIYVGYASNIKLNPARFDPTPAPLSFWQGKFLLSLAPGFSRVTSGQTGRNGFNRFIVPQFHATTKPLKRFRPDDRPPPG
jgi:hypothetical protein